MGFQKPDIDLVYSTIRKSLMEIQSPYNDGFVQMHCKQDLYMLKCWLEDRYKELPTFHGEEKWEQERLVTLLKK